jgi:4a-hydroxytetrahydrobiopterin dehydratase
MNNGGILMDLADMSIEPPGPADKPLTEDKVQDLIARVPGWTLAGDAIEQRSKFADFPAAMAFVNRVAEEAEAADHHPDITVSYNRVTLVLSTHSRSASRGRRSFFCEAKVTAVVTTDRAAGG